MITLYRHFKYDNKYKHIKTFLNKDSQVEFFNSLSYLNIVDTEYIKDNETITIEYDKEYLQVEGYNYISFNNGDKTIYAFITQKEYIRHNLTRIYYEIDVIQTFMFDFSIKNSFITRKVCTLNEITDFDEGIEMGEHILASQINSLEKRDEYFAMFSGFKNYYVQTFTENNTEKYEYLEMPIQDVDAPTTLIDGVPYPLFFYPLSVDGNDVIFNNNLKSLPNLIGIIRFTNVTYSTYTLEVPFLKVVDNEVIRTSTVALMASNIQGSVTTGTSISIPKNNIFDFYPYTYYVITDDESNELILKPQYLSNSLGVNGLTAPSTQPVERYYPTSYKNSTDGKTYYIENKSLSMLPVGTNNGIETLTSGYATYNYNNVTTSLNAVTSGFNAISDFTQGLSQGNLIGATTSAANQIISGMSSIFSQIARNTDVKLTPDSVKSLGTPNTRQKFNTKHVRILKYTIQDKYKNKIQSFINAYGNKYNDYDVIDHLTYKGYIEYRDIDIDSKIDNQFINTLITIFEGGVHIE